MVDLKKAMLVAALASVGVAPCAIAQQTNGNAATPPSTALPGAGSVSDATVKKAGAALRKVTEIQQDFTQRLQTADTPDKKQQLSEQAETTAIQAIGDQGLTVDQYKQVLTLAQTDPNLKQRLISA